MKTLLAILLMTAPAMACDRNDANYWNCEMARSQLQLRKFDGQHDDLDRQTDVKTYYLPADPPRGVMDLFPQERADYLSRIHNFSKSQDGK